MTNILWRIFLLHHTWQLGKNRWLCCYILCVKCNMFIPSLGTLIAMGGIKHYWNIKWILCYSDACTKHEPGHEPPYPTPGHSLPTALKHVQPTGVSIFSIQPISVCLCACGYWYWLCLFGVFFPIRENEPGWDIDIQDDVIEECNKHGGVVHIYVDKNSAEVRFPIYI